MRKRINPEIYVHTLSYAYTFWGGAEAHLLDANIVGALSDDGRTHREPSEGKATVAQPKPPWEAASPTQKTTKSTEHGLMYFLLAHFIEMPLSWGAGNPNTLPTFFM